MVVEVSNPLQKSRCVLLAVCLSAVLRTVSVAQVNQVVSVDSAKFANATGIQASKGQVFTIQTTGMVNLASNDGPYITNPDGTILTAPAPTVNAYNFFTTLAVPIGVGPVNGGQKLTIAPWPGQLEGAPYGALLAGFSANANAASPADFPDGFVVVGASSAVTAPIDGFLFLAINDSYIPDNSGSYSATISTESGPQHVEVLPHTLHFSARAAAPGTASLALGVRSTGAAPVSFNTSIQGNSKWISGITPASGQTVPASTLFLNVQINTQGLQVGSYHDVIQFSSSAGNIQVPVALFVSGDGPILGLSNTGFRFQARQGGGFSNPQTVEVLDVGDPASSLTWTAQFALGAGLFSANALSGSATPATPGIVTLAPTPSALQMTAGAYYGLLKISSPQALNSPQYVVLVLDLASSATPPLPDPYPAGLVFIGTAGQPLNTPQLVNVNTSSATPVPFQVASLTEDHGTWLSATPASGSSTGQSPGQVPVTANPSKLTAGIYEGTVDISMSGAFRSVNVTLIVLPAAPVAASAAVAAAACTPAALALTVTSVANKYAFPAGWPVAITVQLNDDCGNSVSDSSVTASFSNGDPPLQLRPAQSGAYSATWQPGVVSPQTAVTIQAQSSGLKPALALLTGSIRQNSNAPPFLSENGTVNAFNRVPAGALAPGTIVEVYGTGLATTQGNPGVLPLPASFQGTSLIVGPYQAPLYFVSGAQLDVEFDTELTPNQQYPVLAILNGAISVPVLTDIAPIQLGIAALADGHAIAQHGADSSYVDANHPAKPGEVLVIYLSGMGATNPSVKSGDPAPGSEPLARVTVAPTVSLDGQSATVQFAGLAPSFVGLYQVNFQVPSNAKTGDLTLIVSQDSVSSNATTLPVAK